MGRKSRMHKERRIQNEAAKSSGDDSMTNHDHPSRADELEDQLRRMADGDAVIRTSEICPDHKRESVLEDIIAFESVGSGPSLFQGLQENGIELPPPERLDEQQSYKKVTEILHALARLRIFFVGFEGMTACQFYSTLWNQTLWEGCYVEKRDPGALTLIDVSHSWLQQDWREFLDDLTKAGRVQ